MRVGGRHAVCDTAQRKREDDRRESSHAAGNTRRLPALRRAYGLAMLYLGFSQQRANQEETAVATLEEARKAYKSIAHLSLDDLPAAVGPISITALAPAAMFPGRALIVRAGIDDPVRSC